MTRKELAERLRTETDGVHAAPVLVQRTLRAAYGKEEKPVMKKKIAWAAAIALLAVMLCAAAIAAANRWGMLDFIDRYAVDHYIPEDAQTYVQTDVAQLENEWVTVSIRELYYDGRTSRMTVDVTPNAEHVLLVGEDICLSDPFINLTHEYVMDGENDMRTVYQVIGEEGYEAVYAATSCTFDAEHGITGGSMDYILGEDGTLTIFQQEEYAENRPQREVTFQAILMPYDAPLDPEGYANYAARKTLEATIKMTASVTSTDALVVEGEIPNVYVSREPAEYPSVGVRVDRVMIEVKPQDIYAIIEYTVTDMEAYVKTEHGLWFEFIDPDREIDPGQEGDYVRQRLTSGLSGGGMVSPIDDDRDEPTMYRQTETLGRNELHETYTLRAFNCWEKDRYETHTFEMRPATAEDMETVGESS
ncbi:MAG: hypothetical protein ACI4O4_06255 [Candidatus Ventricola sp.]